MSRFEIFVNSFSKLGKRVSDLSRIRRLMAALGDPQERLKFIHVAGTNGKGSTSEMLAGTLAAAGYKTGLFTSPYILRYNDRIRINGEDIEDEELDRLSDILSAAVSGMDEGFSQFEITQAMAMLYYERSGCDIVVLEAGLGGLLDSTNIIPPPEAAVITSVALDHTAILGGAIGQIAEQKAGIIKSASPAICSASVPPQALDVIRRRAREVGAQLFIPDMGEASVRRCDLFGSELDFGDVNGIRLNMGGEHMIRNAAAAIQTVRVLRRRGYSIPDDALRKGLACVIPARLQILNRDPLVILDGGHNPEGIGALAAALDTLSCKKRAVIGMLKDKDSEQAARLIARSAERFVCVSIFYPNALDAQELAGLLRSEGANAEASPLSPEETVRRELAALPDGDALVINGSLFLASRFADGKFIQEILKRKEVSL